ncbi:Protein SGT1 like, partial [Schistosoma japonicum]
FENGVQFSLDNRTLAITLSFALLWSTGFKADISMPSLGDRLVKSAISVLFCKKKSEAIRHPSRNRKSQGEFILLYLTIPTGDELLRKFHLLHDIVPEKSSYRVTGTKVEIKLRKREEVRWSHLETQCSITSSGLRKLKLVKLITFSNTCFLRFFAAKSQDVTKIVHSYPSSSKSTHDWNKIDKEAAEIEGEEDPLNKLFKNIYENASDDTRKAMVKSFTESAGTVLSTNWNEVGAGKVEMRPPDGMEYKKYEM